MKKESKATCLRIYIGESDQYKGVSLYKVLLDFLRKNNFAGATVLRGVAGFGHASRIHTADLLDLSSDLPILIEIVDKKEKIDLLKTLLDKEYFIGSALITEEEITIIQYGKKENPSD